MMKHLFSRFILLMALSLLSFSSVFSQLSVWDFGGYAKNLTTGTDGQIEWFPVQIGKWQNATQLRLNLFMYPDQNITTSIQTRSLIIYQDKYDLVRQFQGEFKTEGNYFFDLKHDWFEKENAYGYSEIDRLYIDWIYKDWEVVLGRHRIAWGTCLVWNPTDLFNPFDILDFDYEERPGADALQILYYTGPLSQFDIAVSPGRTRYDAVYAGRYVTNHWNYDFSFIAGWKLNGLRLGSSWAGEIYDGGFRGEVLYTNPNIKYTTINLNFATTGSLFRTEENKNPYWTFVLSYDYTFENSLFVHTEYLYNGLGTTGKAGFRQLDIIHTGELSPARHSVFQEFAYQITPLLRGDFFIILNPDDKSWLAAPSLTYSVATNWDLYLLAFPSKGDPGTEYSGFPNQYFARVKFSF